MMAAGPIISLITWGSKGGPFPRVMRWMAKGLLSLGRTVDVVFIQDPPGVKTVSPGYREIGLGSRARTALFPLVRYFRENKPSLAIVSPAHCASVSLLAGRLAGVPVVPQEPALLKYDMPFFKMPLRVGLSISRRITYRFAPAIAAVSSDVAQEVTSDLRLGKRVFILPNPCDVDGIRRFAIKTQEPKKAVRIIAIGRLTHEKGFDILLHALRRVSDEGLTGWELIILGEGPLRQSLEGLIATLDLNNQVQFLGYVPNPYPYMAQSDIFVHPARWEGFGMVIVEVMALGLPVIATSCPGGPKDILEHGRYGRLVLPEDKDALAQAIIELIERPEERKRLAALAQEGVERYRPEAIAQRILEIEQWVQNARKG